MPSKASRVRVSRSLLVLLYTALQDALKKRRMDPVEFKLRLSHKHAKVLVTPKIPEVLADREVRDVIKRVEHLLAQNQP